MSYPREWKSFLLEKILLPAADVLTRQHVMASYRFFRDTQWWSRTKLLKYQEARLLSTFRTAYKEVPFYRELFDRHGVRVDDQFSRSDLKRLPPVTKDDLRAAYPDRCVRPSRYPVREFFTSGSSGQPFAVSIDNKTLSDARALMFLRANFSGWEIGDPLLQTGMSIDRGVVKMVKDILLGVHYVPAFDLSDSSLDRYLSIVENKRIRFIMGYPGSIYILAKRALQVSFNYKLKGVVCWGDNLYWHYRHEMEAAFGCHVTDTYGCGEGIQVAAQCGEGNGAYHIFMPHVIVEVVDESGTPVRPGALGTILLTRLDPGAMPLIRYRIGDIGRMGPSTPCPCGREWETLSCIEGRDTDVIVTPRGNRLVVHFFTGIFEYFPSIDTFRIVQDRVGSIRVEIVPRPEFKLEHWEAIRKEILEKGDPDIHIDMELVKEIRPEKSNKRRFVVSKLSPDQRYGSVAGRQ